VIPEAELAEVEASRDAGFVLAHVSRLIAAVRELQQWKESAMTFLTRYEDIADSIGGELGSGRVDNLRKFVQAALAQQSSGEVLVSREEAAKIAETIYADRVFDVDSILRAEIAAHIRALPSR